MAWVGRLVRKSRQNLTNLLVGFFIFKGDAVSEMADLCGSTNQCRSSRYHTGIRTIWGVEFALVESMLKHLTMPTAAATIIVYRNYHVS